MVGFGSSLRLARRPGWDGAYFDYETLKLLLSQIEAVYEDVQQQWGLDPNDDDDTTDNTDILQDHPRRRNTGRTDDDIDDENPPNSRQQRRHRRIHRPNQQQQQSKQSRGNKNNNSNSLPEQLFLESDSDVAYGSMEEEDDDDDGNADNGDDQDDFYGTEEEEDPVQPFSLSHSQKRRNNKNEPISYASVDADNDDEGETTAQRQQNSSLCWGGTGNSSSSSSGWNASSKHGPNKSHHSSSSKAQKKREHSTAQFLPSIPDGTEEDAFYNILTGTMQHSATKASGGNNRAAANRFYMTAPNNISSNNNPNSQVNASALNDYFNQTTLQYFPTPTTPTPSNNNETTRLLPSTRTSDSVATTPTSLLYTFSSSAAGGGNLSPPSLGFFPRQQTNNASSSYDHPVGGGGGEHSKNSLSTDVFSSPMLPPYLRKGNRRSHASSMPRSTKPSRRQHRSRRQRNCLKQRNVVPRNLQIAHTKARAITERFLGLLRAETEKVMLFAQSRLGELADTAGSLRFPAFDEHSSTNNANRISSGNDGKTGGTYEFGDGGMHPSASSSSDDGAVGGLNGRQWTDSSDDEHDYDEKSNSGKVKISGRHHSLPTKRNGPMGVSPSASAYISMSKSVSGGGLSDDTPTNATARTKDMNGMYMVRRQIAHFEALRKNRVVFQRNEQILGEDMLFLSAVEEADGYTAVGVELIHVLKYVCVNLIAVRKICRKHDRLLMNRMLGGYYKTHGRNSPQDDSGRNTLGGMLARVSGDIYEAHPALIGQLNHYKLVGVYDKKIQKLANSRTVQVVSSCLALSLSEYEVARSRANALTILTRKDDTDDDSIDDSPSTASTISLTRLRFTVMSIFSLREVSRSKRQYFLSYLARATLAFTGIPVAGGGLDGCSRETLGFLVAYDPDAALLRDSGLLFEGLQRSQWARLPLADVMISTLAVATIPGDVSDDFASGILSTEQITVASAVSASPESKGSVWKGIIHGQLTRRRRFIAAKTLPPIALEHSRLSLFLYTTNYYLVHATIASFVRAVDVPSAFSALVIGAPNVSAAIIAFIHCLLGAQAPSTIQCRFSDRSVYRLFLFGSLSGFVGNTIMAFALTKNSLILLVTGRFCVGFSSAEIVQRELVASCTPSQVVSESARLVIYKVAGMVAGFSLSVLLTFVVEMIVGDGTNISSSRIEGLQNGSWIMAVLWLCHYIRILLTVIQPGDSFLDTTNARSTVPSAPDAFKHYDVADDHGSDSESSSSVHIGTPSSVMHGTLLKDAIDDPIETALVGVDPDLARRDHSRGAYQLKPGVTLAKVMSRFRKLFAFHVGIPVMLMITFFVTLSLEIFFTASPMVVKRYFAWTGEEAGLLLVCLSLFILPIHVVCEMVARRYEERTILKRALSFVTVGLLIAVNWESMFSLAKRRQNLFADVDGGLNHPYDWKVGVFQYIIGLTIVFVGLVSIEGAALSLVSKLSPVNTRSLIVNVGTTATFLGLAARIMGNFQIVAVDLSHKLINVDIVNSLVVPLLLASLLLRYFIGKKFFFLM